MHLVFEVIQDSWCPNKENPSVYWIAALSCPFMASNYAIRILVRSRSDLVLDADHALDVVFQTSVDERQITHLICARLKYDLYDFFRGCFGAFCTRKRTGSRPKTPLKKSYRSYLRRAQIR